MLSTCLWFTWRSELPSDSVAPRARRQHGRAGTVVSGTYDRDGSGLRFHAAITDRWRRRAPWLVRPFSAAPKAAGDALDSIAQRVVGGVAVLGHPSLSSLLPVATAPPRFEAYQEFLEGVHLRSRNQRAAALHQFRLATALDTVFRWPLVQAALAAFGGFAAPGPEADTVLRQLSEARDRLSALERHLLDHVLAVRVEDWASSYRAMREAAALAPEHFSYAFAIRASTLNRPGEAAEILSRPGLDSVYRDDVKNYWFVLSLSYHQVGQHRRELAVVRRARRRHPQSASLLAQELRALAALGRVESIRARLDTLFALQRDAWYTPAVALTQVGLELRAHGHRDAASEAFARAIAWHRHRPAAELATELRRFQLGEAEYAAGNLDAADSIFRRLRTEFPDNVDYLGYLGTIAARQGNTTLARTIADELRGRESAAPVPGQGSIVWRASIHAILGDVKATMDLLLDAYGEQGTMELHTSVDFESMRAYPAFREFVRPRG